jgi:hypothetical protein
MVWRAVRGRGIRSVGCGVAARLGGVTSRSTGVALLACAIALVLAAPARAAFTHSFVSKVAEAPPGTPLKEPAAATVERSSGRVFVVDPGAGAIDVFSSTGSFVTQFGEALEPSGVAVDESSGDVYVAAGTAVVVFKPKGKGGYQLLSEWEGAGTPAKEFGELRGVAVDNSKGPNAGDVYVLDGSSNLVDVYKPKPPGPEEALEGAFLSSLKGGRLEGPNAIALDASTGKVYVADSPKGVVDVYSSGGVFESKLTGAGSPEGSFKGPEGEEGNVRAIAAEEGDLYVAEAERHVVSQFNATGEWIGWVTGTPAPFAEPDGVAVAPGGGLYVADALTGQLDIFGPGVVVPDAKTNAASKIAKTSVTLSGVVNGDGKPAKYHFEWGTTEAYGRVTPTSSAGAGEERVKAEVAGLTAGERYHFRLVTENENGTNVGAGKAFETRPAVEGLSTGPVANLKPTEATLTGTLSPNGTDAHYAFEWGTTTAYGQLTPSVDAGSAKEVVAAKAELQSLQPNTTYHYRLVGSNSFGATTGADAQFTTPGPPQIMNEPTSAITHEAATLNAKIDPGELETTYHFQYGETTSYGTETPVGKLPAGEAFAPVSAPLTGLKIGTVYHYRLIAENSDGKTTGPDRTFETVPPALIEGTSSIEVSATAATLAAQVNPLGHDTTYYLQYGTEPCQPKPAGCTNIPAPPGSDIGAGETPVPVSQKIEGLKPQTTYHYRVLAINSLGTSEGPEHQLTTQPGETPLALADNRAWEMVTPPNKHGAPVEPLTREGGLILAAQDGNSLTYVANGSIVEEPQGNRSPEQQQDIATRTTAGWTTQDIATPNTRAQGVSASAAPEYQYFTPSLSSALVQPWATTPFSEPPLAPEAKQATMYVRNNSAETYLPLVTEGNVPAGTEFGNKAHFLTATPDLTHVVLTSEVALTPPPSGKGLYEWAAGRLQFVSLLPDRKTVAPAAELGLGSHVVAKAVSNDGTRVIWTNKEENTGAGHLYLTDTATSQTLQLDMAVGLTEPSIGSAEFQTASNDGTRIFFTDKQQLTTDSTAQPAFPEQPDLYECEIAEEAGKLVCHLKDLTVDHNSGEHANVQGLIFGASEDGSTVYVVAQGVLTSNEDGNGEHAETAKDNLYELRASGTSWTTAFVAQLASEDSAEWEGNRLADTAFLTARVSPNGRYLAFMSQATPTGYNNVDQASGKPDEEVYLYDSLAAHLTCVSCNPTGARPRGVLDTLESGEGIGLLVDRRQVWAALGHEHWLAGSIPGWTAQSLPTATSPVGALVQSRYLSDEGRLFFNSPDDLVPLATNHKEDVYEYEPSGVGSCESLTGGCISLMSSGGSSRESAFLEATPGGSDVFFLTAAPLLVQDSDTAFDIYDARVCTPESPCLTPSHPPSPGCSRADACHPAEPGRQTPIGPAGTATFSGPGNAAGIVPATGNVKSANAKKPKVLTRLQKLAQALSSCKKHYHHSRRRRATCEARARAKWRGRGSGKTSGRLSRGRK